jgi:hypothetical protein
LWSPRGDRIRLLEAVKIRIVEPRLVIHPSQRVRIPLGIDIIFRSKPWLFPTSIRPYQGNFKLRWAPEDSFDLFA